MRFVEAYGGRHVSEVWRGQTTAWRVNRADGELKRLDFNSDSSCMDVQEDAHEHRRPVEPRGNKAGKTRQRVHRRIVRRFVKDWCVTGDHMFVISATLSCVALVCCERLS